MVKNIRKDIGTSADIVHSDEDGQGEFGWGFSLWRLR